MVAHAGQFLFTEKAKIGCSSIEYFSSTVNSFTTGIAYNRTLQQLEFTF